MTHWGWYWKVKKKHIAKPLCSWSRFMVIDSFELFKSKQALEKSRRDNEQIGFQIPKYQLEAIFSKDKILVNCSKGSYTIDIDAKPCNFGGYYRFFLCPACKARMRKLYCIEGIYVCRKCARLGYLSQRLRPAERLAQMGYNVKDLLKSRSGSLEKKPPWMKKSTFQKLRIKYVKYDEKQFYESNKELLAWYGVEGGWYFPPSDMFDAHVERK